MNDDYFMSGEHFFSYVMTNTSYIDQVMMMFVLS